MLIPCSPCPPCCIQMCTLLHIEELQQELDVRSYDMRDVCFGMAGVDFLSLEV